MKSAVGKGGTERRIGRGQWVDLQMGYFVQIPLAATRSHDPSWLVSLGHVPAGVPLLAATLCVEGDTDDWLTAISTTDGM